MRATSNAIFVVGSPRSGTTMVGEYLSSPEEVLGMGEYVGFYVAAKRIQEQYAKIPSPFIADYIESLQAHAIQYVEDRRVSSGCTVFCDHAPFNIFVLGFILKHFPSATIIVMKREFRGVMQSLERSYEDGFLWAGSTIEERADVWAKYYNQLEGICSKQIVVLDFDKICSDPERKISDLTEFISSRIKVPTRHFDRLVLARSWANSRRLPRPTILEAGMGGDAVFRPVSSFDATKWKDEWETKFAPIFNKTEKILVQFFEQHPEI